jgi:hypothetical protein
MSDPDDTGIPSWRQRPRPIGLELAYRLRNPDELEIDSNRKIDRIRLSAVEQVRFFHAPSNISSKGFRTRLRLANGKTVTFGNLSWRSLTDIERDDARYHAFVAALAAAIAQANPKARFLAGKPYPLWLALTLAGGGAMAMLAVFSLRALQQGATAAAGLGLVLAAASVWQVWPMIRLNRPRDLASGEVPDDLVPGRQAA